MNYTLKNYDALLRVVRECDDYWADVGILDAIAFLEAFSDQEWIMLQDLLAERPRLWQRSCAETLSEVTNQTRSFDLLLRLMQEGDDEVTIAALDSINALACYGLDISGQATQLRDAIAKARSNAGAAVSRMLDALSLQL
ncbi:hypothetical protein [Pseudoduganella sp. R-43]|uniref:hypothetical protein n=1 Tax=Pseudoduganella sp. R-43 TaxID=3404063 RepID=UPI003CE965E7